MVILGKTLPTNQTLETMRDLQRNKEMAKASPAYAFNLLTASIQRDRANMLRYSEELKTISAPLEKMNAEE